MKRVRRNAMPSIATRLLAGIPQHAARKPSRAVCLRLVLPLLLVVASSAGPLADTADLSTLDPRAPLGISVPTEISPEPDQISRAALLAPNSPFQHVNASGAQIPVVTVAPDPMVVEEKLHEATASPRTIGIGVPVPELSSDSEVRRRLELINVATGGMLLGIQLRAVGAVGMRLGLLIEHLPDQAEITFFAAGASGPVAPPVTGRAINHLIELNRTAGDASDEGRTYWSPVVNGEDAVIWIYLPQGIDPGALEFSVPRISYIFQDPLSEKANGTCELDATCYPSWAQDASGVAMMIYTQQGITYQCTGVLLNDSDTSSFVPYFLSANHCISTQTAASTLQTLWYYQSARCNGSSTDPHYAVHADGAQLLYASAETDTSFMRLRDQPPSGTSYLGWTTASPDIGATVVGIHHIDEGFKDISFGGFDGFFAFGALTASAGGSHIGVTWTGGVTGDGGSGSPLLNSDGEVIGQLHGGRSSCSNPEGMDYYGRFDLAYYAALDQWLGLNPQMGAPTIAGSVKVSGTGMPVCALVLANGQDMFSCDGTGALSLTVPLDANGEVTLFGFADGFAPYRAAIVPKSLATTVEVDMQPATLASPSIAMTHILHCAGSANWVHIEGSISSGSGQSLCALVLANGQQMFSCGASLGQYDLTVPVDQNGQVTLFGFADGFQPQKELVSAPTCNGSG